MRPLLSIVIPNYNYSRFLPRFFQALATQTLNLALAEVIFVDDGSTDGSPGIAEKLMKHLPFSRSLVLKRKHRGKPGLTRNAGLTRAEGNFLVCLDPDDLLLPEYLEYCIESLESGSNIDIAYTDYVEVTETGERTLLLPDFDSALLRTQNILPPTAMLHRAVWEDSRGYRGNTTYEDWDFWVQAAARGCHCKRLGLPLYRYMVHDTNFSFTAREQDGPAKAAIVGNNPSFFDPAVRQWARALVRGEHWASPFTRGVIPRPEDVARLAELFRQARAERPPSS
jgi:glycosyltransferase involved in cell wall biosynthesis